MATGSSFAADVFYETRLNAGREALTAGKHLEAAENLRIACFGLLDHPAALSPCLAMLSIAQNSLGRSDEVDTTLGRFVEVETRFPSWDPASVDTATRRAFAGLIQQRIPRLTLASLPRVAAALGMPGEARVAPVGTEVPKPGIVTPAKPAPAVEKPMTVPPVRQPVAIAAQPLPAGATANAATQTTSRTVTTANSKPPVAKPPAKQPLQTATVKPVPAAARPVTDPLADARRLIADRRTAEAVKVLEAAVIQAPQRRDVRLALLQAAVFASDWKKGVAQIQPLRPFRDAEAAYTFYAAVALYENGSRSEARSLLTPVKSRLARSPLVDDYSKKIFGTSR